jgi:hypothetical protein
LSFVHKKGTLIEILLRHRKFDSLREEDFDYVNPNFPVPRDLSN